MRRAALFCVAFFGGFSLVLAALKAFVDPSIPYAMVTFPLWGPWVEAAMGFALGTALILGGVILAGKMTEAR